MEENNLEISIRVQEKFEFYFLSLTFVVLGLSIQTSKFGDSNFANGLEIMSWACLFISGIYGLNRMQLVPGLYKVAHEISTRKQILNQQKYRQSQNEKNVTYQGTKMPIGDFINKAEQGVKDVKNQFDTMQGKLIIKYKLHIWGFIVGLLFLMCSRALNPALRMVEGAMSVTDKQQSIEIKSSFDLTEDEIEKMKKGAEEYADNVSAKTRGDVENAVNNLKEVAKKKTVSGQQQTGPQEEQSPSPEGEVRRKGGDDVIDAEIKAQDK